MVNPAPVEQFDRVTLAQALKHFEGVELPSRPRCKPLTRRAYLYNIRRFLAFFPDLLYVDELTLAVIKQFQAELDRLNIKGTSKHAIIAGIKVFVEYLEKQKLTPEPFSKEIEWPKTDDVSPRPLSEAEYKALLREASFHPRDAAILEMLLQTGIRLSELIGLALDDLTPPPSKNGVGIIRVRRKGGNIDAVPLNYKAYRAVEAYLKHRPKGESTYLFLSKYGTQLTARSVQKLLKKYAKAAGVPWAHVHTLRTTFISHHLKNDPVHVIKELAGHKYLTATTRYAGVFDEDKIKAVQEHAL